MSTEGPAKKHSRLVHTRTTTTLRHLAVATGLVGVAMTGRTMGTLVVVAVTTTMKETVRIIKDREAEGSIRDKMAKDLAMMGRIGTTMETEVEVAEEALEVKVGGKDSSMMEITKKGASTTTNKTTTTITTKATTITATTTTTKTAITIKMATILASKTSTSLEMGKMKTETLMGEQVEVWEEETAMISMEVKTEEVASTTMATITTTTTMEALAEEKQRNATMMTKKHHSKETEVVGEVKIKMTFQAAARFSTVLMRTRTLTTRTIKEIQDPKTSSEMCI